MRRFLAGEPLDASFDGHTNCFIETGFGKALLIDFNYDTEPLPGHFPGSVGLPLLKESRLNHLGQAACSSRSTGTACCPAVTFPASARPCPPRGKDSSVHAAQPSSDRERS